MPFNVKGITVEIDGDATKLTDALKQVDREYANLDKSARELKKAANLNGEDTGLDTYRTQLKMTAEQASRTAEKTDLLKQAIEKHSSTVAAWKSRLAEAKSQMKNLETQITSGKDALKHLENQHKNTSDQLAKEKQALETTRSSLDTYKSTLTAVENEEKQVKSALEKEEAAHTKLQTAIDKNKTSQQDLENKAANLRQTILVQEEAVNKAKRKYDEAKESLDKYGDSSELSAEDQQKLEQAVTDAETAWTRQLVTLNKTTQELEKTERKLKETKDEQTRLKDELGNSEQKIASYKDKLSELGNTKDQLKSKIEQLKAKEAEQQAQVEKTTAEYENEEQGIALLKDEIKKLETEYSKLETESKTLQANIANEEKSLETLRVQYQKNIEELKNYKKELIELAKYSGSDGTLAWGSKMAKSLSEASTQMEKLGNKSKWASATAAAGLTLAANNAIKAESAFTGLTKTIDATPEQLSQISDGLWDIAESTGTSYEELAKFGELGGQLGIATDDILAFAQVVNDLGNTTNIVGEEGAANMAKFANLMRAEFKQVQQDTGDWYERYGSTIVDLGNNFATTEADIQNMSMRLAAAGTQCGLSTPDILALSTTLSSMGLKTDEAGSSMSKFMQKIQKAVETGSSQLPVFAEIAGMTADEFASAWRDNASTALLAFIEGLASTEDGSSTLLKLSEAGLDTEIRMTRALGGMANGHELYAQAIKTATNAWQENTAMQVEAEKRYGTTESAINKAKESLKRASVEMGATLAPAITTVCDAIQKACTWFRSLSDGTKTAITAVTGLVAAFSPVMKIGSKVASGLSGAITTFTGLNSIAGKLAQKMGVYDKAVEATLGTHSSFKNALGKVSSTAIDAADSTDDLIDAIKRVDASTGETSVSIAGFLSSVVNWKAVALAGVGAAAVGIAVYLTKMQQDAYNHMVEVEKSTSQEIKNWEKVQKAVEQYATYSSQYLEQAKNYQSAMDEQRNTTNGLIDTIGNLIEKEKLSEAEQYLLQQAIEQLNSVYPELNLHIDEETGLLTDSEGKIYGNKSALDALGQSLLDTAQKQADFNTLVANMQAMNTAKTAVDMAKSAYDGLAKKVNDAQTELRALNKKQAELNLQNKTLTAEELARQSELRAVLQANSEAYKESQEAFYNAQQEFLTSYSGVLEVLARSDFQGFLNKLSELESQAQTTGIQIPTTIKDGITNGSVGAADAIAYMTQVMRMSQLVDESGKIGGEIPVEVANGIMANAGSAAEAATALQAVIDFTQSIEGSYLAGTDIATELAQGIASGTLTVEEAVQAMNDPVTLQQAYEKIQGDTKAIEDWLAANCPGWHAKVQETSDNIEQTVDETGQNVVDSVQNTSDQVDQITAQNADTVDANTKQAADAANTNTQKGSADVQKNFREMDAKVKQTTASTASTVKTNMNKAASDASSESNKASADVQRNFRELDQNVNQSTSNAARNVKTNLAKAATDGTTEAKRGAADIVQAFRSKEGEMGNTGTNLGTKLKTALSSILNQTKTETTSNSQAIASAMSSGAYTASSAGATMGGNFNSSISGQMSQAYQNVAWYANNIINSIASAVNYARNNPVITEHRTVYTTSVSSSGGGNGSRPILQSGAVATPMLMTMNAGPDLEVQAMVSQPTLMAAPAGIPASDFYNSYASTGIVNPVKDTRTQNTSIQQVKIDYDKLGRAVAKAMKDMPVNITTNLDGRALVRQTVRLMDQELARR